MMMRMMMMMMGYLVILCNTLGYFVILCDDDEVVDNFYEAVYKAVYNFFIVKLLLSILG